MDSIGDYRLLKQKMHEKGAEHDAMMFHALEMESRRKLVLPPFYEINNERWIETISSDFIKSLNNYGRNFWKPLFWLIIFSLSLGTIYALSSTVGCSDNYQENASIWLGEICDKQDVNKISISYLYAFKSFWGPLGVLLDDGVLSANNFWISLLAKLHLILSTIIWFIWILQIRRQFKL